jgi:cation transport ATPase
VRDAVGRCQAAGVKVVTLKAKQTIMGLFDTYDRPYHKSEGLKHFFSFVQVRMVTGDSVITAKAIAGECGILTEGGKVVEGRVVRNYSKEQFDLELPNIDVRNIY